MAEYILGLIAQVPDGRPSWAISITIFVVVFGTIVIVLIRSHYMWPKTEGKHLFSQRVFNAKSPDSERCYTFVNVLVTDHALLFCTQQRGGDIWTPKGAKGPGVASPWLLVNVVYTFTLDDYDAKADTDEKGFANVVLTRATERDDIPRLLYMKLRGGPDTFLNAMATAKGQPHMHVRIDWGSKEG